MHSVTGTSVHVAARPRRVVILKHADKCGGGDYLFRHIMKTPWERIYEPNY